MKGFQDMYSNENVGKEQVMTKEASFSLAPEYTGISKSASELIYDPTPENIEAHVKKRIMDDVREVPQTLGITVRLVPSKKNTAVPTRVDDAEGAITLTLFEQDVIVPFYVKDGELASFDTIKLDKEETPFSKESLTKIFQAIAKKKQTEEKNMSGDAFIGTEKAINDSTDNGFLGPLLRIRDNQRMGGGSGNRMSGPSGRFVSASNFDKAMEKTAQVKRSTPEHFAAIEKSLTLKFANEHIRDMEKIASENIDEHLSHAKMVFGKMQDAPYKDVNGMSNATRIIFPEKDGSEIRSVRAIVFKNLVSLTKMQEAYRSENKEHVQTEAERRDIKLRAVKANAVLVVTENGQYKILLDGSPFFAIEDKEAKWKFNTEKITGVVRNNSYFSIIGDKVIYPFFVKDNSSNSDGHSSIFGTDASSQPTRRVPNTLRLDVSDIDAPSSYQGTTLCSVPNRKFEVMTRDEALTEYSQICEAKDVARIGDQLHDNYFIGMDKNTGVLRLDKQIKDYLRSKDGFDFTTRNTDSIFKIAALEENYIELEVLDRERNLFNLKISYRAKGLMKPLDVKSFEQLQGDRVASILRVANIPAEDIAMLITKATQESVARVPLSKEAILGNIRGGDVAKSKTYEVAKKLKETVFSPRNLDTMFQAIVGDQLGQIASGSNTAGKALEHISKWASEAKACSIYFEKLATETNNDNMLGVAKVSALSYRIAKLAEESADGHDLIGMRDAIKAVNNSRDAMEKTASELIALKRLQDHNDNHIVNNAHIVGAISSMQHLIEFTSAL